MIKKTLSFLLVVILILSCSESGTDPIDNTEPGRRDYAWEEDTIKANHAGMLLTRIHAVSSSDVWVGNWDNSTESLWHYDGEEWENVSPGVLKPGGIYSYDGSEVWVGDRNSKIWRYNGTDWSVAQTLAVEGFTKVDIMWMCGNSKTNIYAMGTAYNYITGYYIGVIIHYNGTGWSFRSIQPMQVYFCAGYVQQNTGSLIIYGIDYEIGDIDKIWRLRPNANLIEELYSTTSGLGLGEINGEIYINIGYKKIFKIVDNDLVLFKDLSGSNQETSIFGRCENDFISGAENGIGHYNGIDYQTIYETHLLITGLAMTEQKIFVITTDWDTGCDIIIRGTLQN